MLSRVSLRFVKPKTRGFLLRPYPSHVLVVQGEDYAERLLPVFLLDVPAQPPRGAPGAEGADHLEALERVAHRRQLLVYLGGGHRLVRPDIQLVVVLLGAEAVVHPGEEFREIYRVLPGEKLLDLSARVVQDCGVETELAQLVSDIRGDGLDGKSVEVNLLPGGGADVYVQVDRLHTLPLQFFKDTLLQLPGDEHYHVETQVRQEPERDSKVPRSRLEDWLPTPQPASPDRVLHDLHHRSHLH